MSKYDERLKEVEKIVKEKYTEYYDEDDFCDEDDDWDEDESTDSDTEKSPNRLNLYKVINNTENNYDCPGHAYNSDIPGLNDIEGVKRNITYNFECYVDELSYAEDTNDGEIEAVGTLKDILSDFASSKDFRIAYTKLNNEEYLDEKQLEDVLNLKTELDDSAESYREFFTSLISDVVTKSDHAAYFSLAQFYCYYMYIVAEIDGKVLEILMEATEVSYDGTPLSVTISYT